MAEEKYNRKTTAVKRILQEMKEMQSNAYDDFMNLPLEVERNFVDEEANLQSLAQSSMGNKRHLQIGAAIIQATKHHDLLTESNSKSL